ncbi:MAG: heavy metal translocating P-type ATPase [Gammaproteobacteria bacterium]|uniref:Heavy metal translocating P-type ATPase n=1 Tax=Candidatus Thiopontia autotrophica TaxID=2841688 RepID=A0A8J6TMR4_9GAMM|nr:heavy metal translocating P-type ATPase [Candidatus Thiopontia autotrophica]
MSGHHAEGDCFHCGLSIPDGGVVSGSVEGKDREFCCYGCKSVCQVIFDSGMEGFYDRTPEGTLLAPPPELSEDAALFDLEEIQQEYVSSEDNISEINLLVEGIHCAACVWLIERTLTPISGVVSAQVNLSGKRLHLRWDKTQIKLSELIKRLSHIGYAAVPFDPETAEGRLRKRDRSLLYRLVFAGFAMMNLLWISIALYSGADQGEFRTWFHWLGFALATPTLLYSGYPFLRGAWTGMVARHLTMDLPIAIGATTTYLYSTYITINGSQIGDVYFDTVVNFIFVILIGRYLESAAKRKAVSSTQRLMDLQPRVATIIRDGSEEVVPVRSLVVGDMVMVKPGQRIPVDGELIDGVSEVDEAMLSGESLPVSKKPGDLLYAGTVNGHGVMRLRVDAVLKNSALGKIIDMVEDAQASKAPIQCTADRIVPWFVSLTLFLGAVTFLFWVGSDFEVALMAATSVLIITCPCAFGLATPMAIAVASGVGARHGVLIKNGGVLEMLSSIRHIVFDKTGTLTEGKLGVRDIYLEEGWDNREFYRIAYALERYSEHSVAKVIVRKAEEQLGNVARESVAENFTYSPGAGISGIVDGRECLLGTAAWMEQHDVSITAGVMNFAVESEAKAESVVFLSVNGLCVGGLSLADKLRSGTALLLSRLRQQGMRFSLLTGDRQKVAEAVVNELGEDMSVIAEVLPDEKAAVIRDLQKSGEQIAMVGDGINDAPALTMADVGIAMGSGTDVSVESADIVLLSSEIEQVELANRLSQRTLRTIRQNIGISILYNVIMVPLAMMALITPLVAAISMPVSSLLVIGNAARIRSEVGGRATGKNI